MPLFGIVSVNYEMLERRVNDPVKRIRELLPGEGNGSV
jgi:hypothetical protein